MHCICIWWMTTRHRRVNKRNWVKKDKRWKWRQMVSNWIPLHAILQMNVKKKHQPAQSSKWANRVVIVRAYFDDFDENHRTILFFFFFTFLSWFNSLPCSTQNNVRWMFHSRCVCFPLLIVIRRRKIDTSFITVNFMPQFEKGKTFFFVERLHIYFQASKGDFFVDYQQPNKINRKNMWREKHLNDSNCIA